MLHLPSPLTNLYFTNPNNISVYIKRDDLIHPYISGNKWRKLNYNIIAAKQQGKTTLLTFGGAYSNHIMATAYAAKQFQLKSIGIIRGNELNSSSNANLSYAHTQAMKLFFVDRTTYQQRYDDNFITQFCVANQINYDEIYVIPEGGSNDLAVKGCKEIITEIDSNFDYIITACGTGTTLAGIAASIKEQQQAIGIAVLNNEAQLHDTIKHYTNRAYILNTNYTFGGYAKTNETLFNFIQNFQANYGIELDYVYTGKMMYGIFDLIHSNYFAPQSTIIALHTGGVKNASVL